MEGVPVYSKNEYFTTVGKVIGSNNIYKTTLLLEVIDVLEQGTNQDRAIEHVKQALESFKIQKRTADLLVAMLRRTNADPETETETYAVDQRTNRQRVMMGLK